MNPRFVCLRSIPADPASSRRAREIASRLDESCWRGVLDWRGVTLLVHAEAAGEGLTLPHGFGWIGGPLFERESGALVASISVQEAEALASNAGARLFERHWGPCCAFLHDRGYDDLHVLRDPGGGAPCYVCLTPSLSCVFSHAEDFLNIWDAPVECDEAMLSAFMVQPRLVTKRTALTGVEELLAGEGLTLGRVTQERALIWRADAIGPRFGLQDFDAAAAALRETVRGSARAWVGWTKARGSTPIGHRLSGGLDSSIALGVLNEAAAGEVEIVCFNEFPEATPEGDERAMARVVAARNGRELVEVEALAREPDYAAILRAPLLVRPTMSEFSFASSVLTDAIAARGVAAVTSGQGGDQVLHRSRSIGVAVEAARDHLSLHEWFEVARDTARMARAPIWSVFAATLSHVLGRRELPIFNPAFAQVSLAAADAVAVAENEWRLHPWTKMASRLGAASGARVMHAADLAFYHQPSMITRRFRTAPVLASLPVIETVLSIPPYLMTRGGVERALARAAFTDLLPEAIRTSVRKGDTTRFHNRVLEGRLPFVRELLLGGELVRRGLVRRPLLESALKRDVIADGALKAALMTAFMAEAWLRRFEACRAKRII
jgi:asparagine synthase (glutamine-hydrolysing)